MTDLIKTEMDCGLQLISETSSAISKLDEISEAGRIALASAKTGLARAVVIANCTAKMGALLTPEVMQPIMYLQGREFGFKTDKDDQGGYPMDKVRDCFICASFLGLEPIGNQFNIIGGKTYIASQGRDATLKKMGIKHFEMAGVPEFHSEKTINTKNGQRNVVTYKSDVTITWEGDDGKKQTEVVSFLITANNGMGYDAIIGKAESKAKKYLFKKIIGLDIQGIDDDEELKVVNDARRTPVIECKTLSIEQEQTNYSRLQKELDNLRVTDLSANDIADWYKAENYQFNEDYVIANAIRAVNAYRDYIKAKKEENK